MMDFENQSLSNFLIARHGASELLREAGISLRSEIGFEEALTMQAIHSLLKTGDTFYGYEIMPHTEQKSGTLYPILNKFENPYGITISTYEESSIAQVRKRPPRRHYQATEFGITIFNLFTPKPERY